MSWDYFYNIEFESMDVEFDELRILLYLVDKCRFWWAKIPFITLWWIKIPFTVLTTDKVWWVKIPFTSLTSGRWMLNSVSLDSPPAVPLFVEKLIPQNQLSQDCPCRLSPRPRYIN